MSVVTLSVNNSTRGVVAGGGTYDNGTQITVTATANSGSLFACWSIGEVVVSSNPSYTFSVSGNVTLTAHFYNDIDGAKIYGLCGANGKHRVLNIGQVISLIQEMAANDWKVPTGYIPKTAVNSIVEQSTGKELKFFINTQKVWADYKGDKTDMLFLPTDDTTLTELQEAISRVSNELDTFKSEGKIMYAKSTPNVYLVCGSGTWASSQVVFQFFWYSFNELTTIDEVLTEMSSAGALFGIPPTSSSNGVGYPCSGLYKGFAITSMYKPRSTHLGFMLGRGTDTSVDEKCQVYISDAKIEVKKIFNPLLYKEEQKEV